MGPIKNTIAKEKMRRLAGKLLGMAAEQFSRHGCNDFARPEYFSAKEWARMANEYEQWNSGGEDEAMPLVDFVLMGWLATLIEAGEL